jgi:hypothetical protein
MDELERDAKKEYYLIIGLALLVIAISTSMGILLVFQYKTSGLLQISQVIINYFPIYTTLITTIALISAVTLWRTSRIPPPIKEALISYYQELGYTLKRGFFRTLKVIVSPTISFNVKLTLYRRVSDESYLFDITSMWLAKASANSEFFDQVAERFLLKSNVQRQKFSTSCELEEVHARSLLMVQALEEFTQN